MKNMIWILPAIAVLSSCLSLGGVMDNAFDQATDEMVSSVVDSSGSDTPDASDGSTAGKSGAAGPESYEPTRENVIAAIRSSDVESLKKILSDVDDVKTIVNKDDLLLHMAEEAMGVSGLENPVAELLVEKKAYILQLDENGRSWERVILDMEVAATPRHDFIVKTIGDKFQQRYNATMADDLATFRRFEQYGPLDGPLLWEAGRAKATEIAVYMVEQGADVNYLNSRKNVSTLQATCSNFIPNDHPKTYADFEPIVKALLDAGADPNTQSSDKFTPLLQLMNTELMDNPDNLGDPQKLVMLLLEAGADPNITDSRGWTALDMALGDLNFPSPAAVELMLEYGGEYTEIAADLIFTDIRLIRLLITYGADPRSIAQKGRSYRDEAEQMEYYRYMMSVGAEIGDFSLKYCVLFADNLQYMIDQGASVSERYYKERTLLHMAAMNGLAETVDVLIAAGADVNAVDADGKTPLDKLKSGENGIESTLRAAGARESS